MKNEKSRRQTKAARGWRAGVLAGMLAGIAGQGSGVWAADFQGSTHVMAIDEEVIHYSKTPDRGPIARLQDRIDRNEVELEHHPKFGYLLSVLKALNIPVSAQTLVFSKTSFQRDRIAPHTPRAVYAGDGAYIGYVQGSPLLEITSVDPQLGGVFYTMEQKKAQKPKFVRTDNCTECHASAKTMGVPGHLVRSFVCDESGMVDLLTGVDVVNHRTPMADRWGGWYVTGRHGKQVHRGNLFGAEAFARHEKSEPNWAGNLTPSDLKRFFDTTQYPTPGSDIVALMVMEHQSHMQNFVTRINYEARMKLAAYGHVDYLKSPTEAFVRYLLMVEEAPLTEPIEGDPEYQKWFANQGPKDRKGRSLREFDLKTRLFRYPCSYVIYSEAFDGLPGPMKDRVYRRLWEVLTGRDTSETYAGLTAGQRREILEILRDTKKDLPEYWRGDGAGSGG